MMMMKMNALESFQDPHMVYLDITAGIAGFVLTMMLLDGYKDFTLPPILIPLVFMALISRLVVDLFYYYVVSKKVAFGGSNLEFFMSSVIWFCLVVLYVALTKTNQFKVVQIPILYISSVLCMMAIARMTHWG
jgi:hypothetical protein